MGFINNNNNISTLANQLWKNAKVMLTVGVTGYGVYEDSLH